MKQKTKFILLAVIGSSLLFSCGKSSIDPTVTAPAPVVPSTGTTTAAVSFTPTSSYSFSLTGSSGTAQIPSSFTQNGQTVTVGLSTDSIFKVQIHSGTGQKIADPKNGFTAEYGCVQYTVTILGESVTTDMLSVDGQNHYNCRGAPDSQIIDFSGRLSAGHKDIFMTLSNPQYDFKCQEFEAGFPTGLSFCPLTPIYQNHVVSGTIAVETNSLN